MWLKGQRDGLAILSTVFLEEILAGRFKGLELWLYSVPQVVLLFCSGALPLCVFLSYPAFLTCPMFTHGLIMFHSGQLYLGLLTPSNSF